MADGKYRINGDNALHGGRLTLTHSDVPLALPGGQIPWHNGSDEL
jgi:hypothetical protein